jgi:hypothetical protein
MNAKARGVSGYRRIVLSAAVGLAALAASVVSARVAEANVYYLRNGCGSVFTENRLKQEGWFSTGCGFQWRRGYWGTSPTWCLYDRAGTHLGCVKPCTSWYKGQDGNGNLAWYNFAGDGAGGLFFRYYDPRQGRLDVLCSQYKNYVIEKGDGWFNNPYTRVVGSAYMVHPAGNYYRFTPSCP